MGGGAFDVEPADLVGGAREFDRAGADLAAALTALSETLGGLGDHLGSDEQGMAFKAAYEPKQAEAEQAVDTLARGLASIAPELRAAAEQYRGDDASGADSLDGQIPR